MSNRVNIVLLCEDNRHEQFVREFLKKKGRSARRVFPDAYKSHEKGGAKPNNAFVLENAAREIKVARKVPPKRALVLVIDGDDRGAASRTGNLREILKNEGAEPLSDKERIAVVVPCRNIETWIHHFNGHATNETDEFGEHYPKKTYDATPQAKAFAEFVSDGTSSEVPHLPALNSGRSELRRLHQLMQKESD